MDRIGISVAFEKSSDGGYVRGWASVISENGVPVVDHSGDVITMKALRNAAHDFMSEQRIAKVMHKGEEVGEVCEALIVDDDVAKALGATTPYRGLFIGMRIKSADVKKQVRDGKLPMFSVGGRGKVLELEDGDILTDHLDD